MPVYGCSYVSLQVWRATRDEATDFIELGTNKTSFCQATLRKSCIAASHKDPSSTTLLCNTNPFLPQKDAQKTPEAAEMNPNASDPESSPRAGEISQEEATLGILPSHGNLPLHSLMELLHCKDSNTCVL